LINCIVNTAPLSRIDNTIGKFGDFLVGANSRLPLESTIRPIKRWHDPSTKKMRRRNNALRPTAQAPVGWASFLPKHMQVGRRPFATFMMIALVNINICTAESRAASLRVTAGRRPNDNRSSDTGMARANPGIRASGVPKSLRLFSKSLVSVNLPIPALANKAETVTAPKVEGRERQNTFKSPRDIHTPHHCRDSDYLDEYSNSRYSNLHVGTTETCIRYMNTHMHRRPRHRSGTCRN